MKNGLLTSLVFLISFLASGCVHDGPGLRMLNDRAEYGSLQPEAETLNLESSKALSEDGQNIERKKPRAALVWLYPQKLSDREHFWGGWVSLRLEGDHWNPKIQSALEPARP